MILRGFGSRRAGRFPTGVRAFRAGLGDGAADAGIRSRLTGSWRGPAAIRGLPPVAHGIVGF
ncbi:MAG: hypothetical protein AB7O66_16385 [Limisphaerales bacterium]